jgi:propionyl-CoA carboxylase alpha chain
MIAKVVAWADNRAAAAAVLANALESAHLHGITTNRELLVRVLRHPEFLAGQTDTHFLERNDPVALGGQLPDEHETQLAAVAAALAAQEDRRLLATVQSAAPSGWRNSPSQLQEVAFESPFGEITVGYRFDVRGGLKVEVDHQPLEGAAVLELSPERVGLVGATHLRWFNVHRVGEVHHIDGPGGYVRLIEQPRFPSVMVNRDRGSLHAPMPGKVVKVEVIEGDSVDEGQVLVVMEAMKMEHTLRSPHSGTVTSVQTATGDQVEAGQTLVVVEG